MQSALTPMIDQAASPDTNTPARPALGVSACLLGHAVRFDGGHKRNPFLVTELSQYADIVAFCPETAIGLPVPRPPIRLVGDDPAQPRALGVRDASLDVTGRLEDYARSVLDQAAALDGFVLKKDSPSCGMTRVKRYPATGGPASRDTSGIFARILQEHLPELPLEEEGRLNDPVLRENFVNRVYVRRRWRRLVEDGITAARLIDFHTRHKYLVMAHSNAAYRRLGTLLSDLSGGRAALVADTYFEILMEALARRVNRRRHCNVLQHILGYLKKRIDAGDKAELVDAIERYRREEVPLIVPITLFRHYFRVQPDAYIAGQVYLQPHPDTLRLRNQL